MGRSKIPMNYFASDFHFNHWKEWTNDKGEKQGRGIISFERTQFKTIQEHDDYLINMINDWANKWAEGSTFWFLGDWGSLDYLDVINTLQSNGITCNFIRGNHDKDEDMSTFAEYFDTVYPFPVFISQKIVLSHFPVAVYQDMINVHGHTHGSKLVDPNHICASIHVAGYQPITDKQIAATFSKIPKFNRRFLYEPYAADYVFTQPKEDVIRDKDGRIDLSASRVLQHIHSEQRVANGDPYRPFVGE